PWLFPGALPGRHITSETVEMACQEAHRASRISKPITPHSLRHYFRVPDYCQVTQLDNRKSLEKYGIFWDPPVHLPGIVSRPSESLEKTPPAFMGVVWPISQRTDGVSGYQPLLKLAWHPQNYVGS